MKLYLITYDIDSNEADFLATLKQMGDVCNFVKNGWFLVSDMDRNEIFERSQSFFANANGHLLITETSMDNIAGWLSKASIDWLSKVQKNANGNNNK